MPTAGPRPSLTAMPWVGGETGDLKGWRLLVPLCLGVDAVSCRLSRGPEHSSSSCRSSDHTPRTLPLLSCCITRLCCPGEGWAGLAVPQSPLARVGRVEKDGWVKIGHPPHHSEPLVEGLGPEGKSPALALTPRGR